MSSSTTTSSSILPSPASVPTQKWYGPAVAPADVLHEPIRSETAPTVTFVPRVSQALLDAHAANYICRLCSHNCSTGEIITHMRQMYPNDTDTQNQQRATDFGWSASVPLHFVEAIAHREPVGQQLVFVCPNCFVRHPFRKPDGIEDDMYDRQYELNKK